MVTIDEHVGQCLQGIGIFQPAGLNARQCLRQQLLRVISGSLQAHQRNKGRLVLGGILAGGFPQRAASAVTSRMSSTT